MRSRRVTHLLRGVAICLAVAVCQITFEPVRGDQAEAATYFVSAQLGSDTNPGTRKTPWATISRGVPALRPGDTLVVRGGTYREKLQIAAVGEKDAPITIEGAPGEKVVISGADLHDDWEPVDTMPAPIYSRPIGRRWYVHPPGGLWGLRDMVIQNGHILKQLAGAGELYPGSFTVDEKTNTLYVWPLDGADPRVSPLEITARELGLDLSEKSAWVRLRNLTVTHVANMAQTAAFVIQGNNNLVEDCQAVWCNATGMAIEGNANTVRRCNASNNGQTGMIGHGVDTLVEDCTTNHNNWRNINPWWEAGAMKFANTKRLTLRRHTAAHNYGIGIWFDINNEDATIEQCRSFNNHGHGIYYEISHRARIINNLSYGNFGVGYPYNEHANGILVGVSDGVVVANNICVGNTHGIRLWEANRGEWKSVDNARVERNICADNWFGQLALDLQRADKPLAQLKVVIRDNLLWRGNDTPKLGWTHHAQTPRLRGPDWGYLIQINNGQAEGFDAYRMQHNFADLASFRKAMPDQRWSNHHADPMFADLHASDFRLKPESTAIALGIGLLKPAVGMTKTTIQPK
jgi:hypothetical protein